MNSRRSKGPLTEEELFKQTSGPIMADIQRLQKSVEAAIDRLQKAIDRADTYARKIKKEIT